MRLQWLLLVLLLCSGGKAENRCPWLNQETASGVLNGPATLQVQGMTGGEGTCIFRYRHGTSNLSLEIAVRAIKDPAKDAKVYQSHCTSAMAPVRAIGNEANTCAVDAWNSRGQQIVGRVRDLLIVVAMRASKGSIPPVDRETLQQQTEIVSESVAGSLF